MTQSGDPLENAVAERANGILKDRMALQDEHPHAQGMQERELTRIIAFYNDEERPHMSIENQTHISGAYSKRAAAANVEKSLGKEILILKEKCVSLHTIQEQSERNLVSETAAKGLTLSVVRSKMQTTCSV